MSAFKLSASRIPTIVSSALSAFGPPDPAVWMYKQHKEYEPGILMPTRKNPVPALFTAATPKYDFCVSSNFNASSQQYRVLMEINHSTDFNAFYTADAPQGDPAFSGGRWGSGQPSMIWEAQAEFGSNANTTPFRLIGHGSPDGGSGDLYAISANITSVVDIIREAKLIRNQQR